MYCTKYMTCIAQYMTCIVCKYNMYILYRMTGLMVYVVYQDYWVVITFIHKSFHYQTPNPYNLYPLTVATSSSPLMVS